VRVTLSKEEAGEVAALLRNSFGDR
jgi:hypothetical protein